VQGQPNRKHWSFTVSNLIELIVEFYDSSYSTFYSMRLFATDWAEIYWLVCILSTIL